MTRYTPHLGGSCMVIEFLPRAGKRMRRVFRALWIAALVALVACAAKTTGHLDHQAYIWQRQWTPALSTSIASLRDDVSGWRVLAAESTTAGSLTDASPSLADLAREKKPTVAVFRLNGSQPPPSVDVLLQSIDALASAWRAAGVRVAGIEIDHDCATSKLAEYAMLLQQLRSRLPAGMKLSITALPTWIGAPQLNRVLAAVDASVLQVHAISAPGADARAAGLFDVGQARRWIDAYAALVPHSFRIALPAYGVRVGFDESGRALAVAGERERAIQADSVRELRVDPRAVARLLAQLQHARPPQLAGIVWFRLPSEDDRRAWSTATLHAVIARNALRADVVARAEPGDAGESEVVLANHGTLDATLPVSIDVDAADCTAADALSGFSVQRTPNGWQFFRETDAILRAQHQRRVGWLRCASITGMLVHENP